jgi:preprotein translocase subunit SecA
VFEEKLSSWLHKATGGAFLLKCKPLVAAINRAEPAMQALTDEGLKEAFNALRAEALEQPLSALLPRAFALVREASRRTLGVRHYDVQLLGGITLHEGKLAEMRTGEGKTHVVGLAAALNALKGEGVHVVTANAYLAKRDAELLRPVYEALGLTVGVTLDGMTPMEKQLAYQCDITYGVNYEFGFDYLRDNMAKSLADRVQRGQVYAIVDEVDSILIDDARTPLIITEQREVTSAHYVLVDEAVKKLVPGTDYLVDEKMRTATLTEAGFDRLEETLETLNLVSRERGLYKEEDLQVFKAVNSALQAHAFYRRDRHYVVQNGEIVIVDDATGRLMQGRRWGDGLHHAIEARERVALKPESLTVATITYQNYFTMYQKLAGLTGTAATEAEEFAEIYGLATVVIPTNKPVLRKDHPDLMFATKVAKYAAIVSEVKRCQAKGQPVLVGTASVAESERLSALFNTAGIKHQVLNAKQNLQEAEIIADAGLPGAVTIATNMAGRGTDILLGGHKNFPDEATWTARNAAVLAAGGLHVVGTERNESRRVDNQLAGRAGRQGDPGSSQFYLSLEDDLLRVFATQRLGSILANLTSGPGEAASHRLLDKAITSAQKKLENRNFEARRQLMKFDGVLAGQRKAVFGMRDSIMSGEASFDVLKEMMEDAISAFAYKHLGEHQGYPSEDDLRALEKALFQEFKCLVLLVDVALEEQYLIEHVVQLCVEKVMEKYATLRKGDEDLTQVEKEALLSALDGLWPLHLQELEEAREGIHLRSIAQQNPVYAFAREGKTLFAAYRQGVCEHVTRLLLNPQAVVASAMPAQRPAPAPAAPAPSLTPVSVPPVTLSRNAPCSCGSGLRFKECHGKLKAA